MKSVFILLDSVITIYLWIIIINAVLSWLVAFNILNTQNRFVFSVLDATYKMTDPALNRIRRFIPTFGSIDMYIRCFTVTDDWDEWLAVKERLAIEIKQIIEKNNASFAFPSQSIYVEKK